ncbi:hypothetical protein [Agromyces badenianii]|nr:hypothetical protein [Agromyces badenianii]
MDPADADEVVRLLADATKVSTSDLTVDRDELNDDVDGSYE